MIEWDPTPNHPDINNIAAKAYSFDGGFDTSASFALSGESPSKDLTAGMGPGDEQYKASDIAAVNIAKREAQKEYMELWNRTTGNSGNVVDAIICPLAPFPAARRGLYTYYGYATWVNLLDYSAVVYPVTKVDKHIDIVDTDYKPRNSVDRRTQETCKS